ncbi:MAG: hypothetical protein V1767_00955 [Chloroflexota bacterium]
MKRPPVVDNVQEVEIPLLSPTLGVAVLANDGTNLPYSAPNTTVLGVGAPAVGWQGIYNFEQNNAIEVTGLELYLEWQSMFTVGAGVGTDTTSRVEMSVNGGGAWTAVTDWFTHANAALTTRVRAGVGRWQNIIISGVDQLRFRLVHYVGAADGVSQSTVQMRSSSRVIITYRKS